MEPQMLYVRSIRPQYERLSKLHWVPKKAYRPPLRGLIGFLGKLIPGRRFALPWAIVESPLRGLASGSSQHRLPPTGNTGPSGPTVCVWVQRTNLTLGFRPLLVFHLYAQEVLQISNPG